MNKTVRNSGIAIIVFGVIALVMGMTFLAEGFVKQSYLTQVMKKEDITLGNLGITGDKANEVIDNAETAQIAGDTVREHRHSIAPNYVVALGGKRFDPTNPDDLIYAQAINLENYLYLAVAAFGMVTITLATGGFMIITGLALGTVGVVLLKLAKR